ncbi:hypothetical protein DLJ47_32890, partial [Micromonospora sp. S4605]|uniref:hypothetical protein n=1 Tax=Micromonospora sp. S4605 TaxID=1420897 RepID=UPI000D982C51
TTDRSGTRAAVAGFTGDSRVSEANGSAYLVIPNPDGRQADEHPFLGDLVRALRDARVPLRSVVA